jgi:phospholipase/carboxylesterase
MPSIARAIAAAVPRAGELACARRRAGDNRLAARAGAGPASVAPGRRRLKLRQGRDALLCLPASSSKYKKAPVVVSLHRASQNADLALAGLRPFAGEHGFLLRAASKGRTWYAIQGSYGPDVHFIDRSLQKTFLPRAIAPAPIAVAGFSAEASYSLSLGFASGDLFSAVAFCVRPILAGQRTGEPPIFISHGAGDQILPIDERGRRIVAELHAEDCQATFREFDGPHTLPPEVAAEAM